MLSQKGSETADLLILSLETPEILAGHKSEVISQGAEPPVGIVNTQQQSRLGPGREHAIGLIHATGHQVIYQNSDVAFAAGKDRDLPPGSLQGRIDSCHYSLRRGFFI